MNDTPTTSADTLLYYPIPLNCPRCNHPVKAKVPPTVAKILLIKCTHCAWYMDIEGLRKTIKSQVTPIDEEPPTEPQEDKPCP